MARSMFWIAWSRGALQLLTFATTLLVTGAPAARLFLARQAIAEALSAPAAASNPRRTATHRIDRTFPTP